MSTIETTAAASVQTRDLIGKNPEKIRVVHLKKYNYRADLCMAGAYFDESSELTAHPIQWSDQLEPPGILCSYPDRELDLRNKADRRLLAKTIAFHLSDHPWLRRRLPGLKLSEGQLVRVARDWITDHLRLDDSEALHRHYNWRIAEMCRCVARGVVRHELAQRAAGVELSVDDPHDPGLGPWIPQLGAWISYEVDINEDDFKHEWEHRLVKEIGDNPRVAALAKNDGRFQAPYLRHGRLIAATPDYVALLVDEWGDEIGAMLWGPGRGSDGEEERLAVEAQWIPAIHQHCGGQRWVALSLDPAPIEGAGGCSNHCSVKDVLDPILYPEDGRINPL